MTDDWTRGYATGIAMAIKRGPAIDVRQALGDMGTTVEDLRADGVSPEICDILDAAIGEKAAS